MWWPPSCFPSSSWLTKKQCPKFNLRWCDYSVTTHNQPGQRNEKHLSNRVRKLPSLSMQLAAEGAAPFNDETVSLSPLCVFSGMLDEREHPDSAEREIVHSGCKVNNRLWLQLMVWAVLYWVALKCRFTAAKLNSSIPISTLKFTTICSSGSIITWIESSLIQSICKSMEDFTVLSY